MDDLEGRLGAGASGTLEHEPGVCQLTEADGVPTMIGMQATGPAAKGPLHLLLAGAR